MANVNIRVDDALKRNVEDIFAALGLSVSAATNAFYRQVVRYGGIPFELRVETGDNDGIAGHSVPTRASTGKRLTLEQVFRDWDGEAPEPYDWGGLDAPAGRELL